VYKESFDIEGFYHAPIFQCRDQELFILAQGLATKMIVEKIPCEPTIKELYAPVD
jgi:hypothetical protein